MSWVRAGKSWFVEAAWKRHALRARAQQKRTANPKRFSARTLNKNVEAQKTGILGTVRRELGIVQASALFEARLKQRMCQVYPGLNPAN